VAFFPDDAVDPAGLRQAADDALYAAKRAGRGRWHAAVAGAAWRRSRSPRLSRATRSLT
jgi:predicted signal transduction protein with EAL and GGDEF domain